MFSYIKTNIKKESFEDSFVLFRCSKKIKILALFPRLKSWTSQSFREVENVLRRPN